MWRVFNISDEREIIEQLKVYYYTTLSSYEIREIVGISTQKYNKLLKTVKKELGVNENDYRTPRVHNKYHDGCYMIINTLANQVHSYYPTLNSALLKNSEINNPDFIVKKVTDDDMLEMIREEYNKECSWDELQSKFKLPYNRLYGFIHSIKEELHLTKEYRVVNPHRYIYFYNRNGKVYIRKRLGNKNHFFGYYDNYDDAMKIRDYLESIGWDYDCWLCKRDYVKEKLLGHA